jgi:hypothetical protein
LQIALLFPKLTNEQKMGLMKKTLQEMQEQQQKKKWVWVAMVVREQSGEAQTISVRNCQFGQYAGRRGCIHWAQAKNPRPMKFITVSDEAVSAIHAIGCTCFDEINQIRAGRAESNF